MRKNSYVQAIFAGKFQPGEPVLEVHFGEIATGQPGNRARGACPARAYRSKVYNDNLSALLLRSVIPISEGKFVALHAFAASSLSNK